MTELTISPASVADKAELVALWHSGWHEAHAPLVPEAVLAFRTLAHFYLWFEQSRDVVFVARGDTGMGFVAISGRELSKLYVSPAARGTTAARQLLGYAERYIGQGHEEAELLCTDGNLRAQRFYEREGWALVEVGPEALWVPEGCSVTVETLTRRYRKSLMAKGPGDL